METLANIINDFHISYIFINESSVLILPSPYIALAKIVAILCPRSDKDYIKLTKIDND